MAECLLSGLLSRRNYSWLVSVFFILLFVCCCLFVHFIFVFCFLFVIIHCFNFYLILDLWLIPFLKNVINFCIRFQTFCIIWRNSFCGTLCYSYDDQWTNRSADQQKINRHLFQWSINHNYSLLGMVFMSFSKYAKNKLHLKKILKYGCFLLRSGLFHTELNIFRFLKGQNKTFEDVASDFKKLLNYFYFFTF